MAVTTRITVYEGTSRVSYYVDMYVLTCASCGVVFGITSEYEAARREDARTFHCPNGHTLSWKESEADRLKKERDSAIRQRDWANQREQATRDQLQASERSLRATKGHITRLRNKIANGVCPVPGCHRYFENVHRHITGQHPEWAHDHPEAMA
jgi:hypothetical protein